MDMFNSAVSGLTQVAGAGAPAQPNNDVPNSPEAATNSAPKFSREDLRAVLADPELTKAIKQASEDGMKEGYIKLMKHFLAELPRLLKPMLKLSAGADPITALNDFMAGIMGAFNNMTGSKASAATVTETPKNLVEGKPTAESSQANDIMKVLAQYMPQAQTAQVTA